MKFYQNKMKYTILLPLLFILQNIEIKGAGNNTKMKFKIDIIGRPNSPYDGKLENFNVKLTKQGDGKDYPVTVSRHHIIPFNRLAAFYNHLVLNKQTKELSKVFWAQFIDKFTKFYQTKKGNHDATIKNVNKLVKGLSTGNIEHDPYAKTPEGFDDFQAFYAWLPGNLFIGPNKRSDDPGEGFEKNAKTIVGARRFDNLKNVYDLMQAYIDRQKIDFEKLSRGLYDITNILQPQILKSSDWVLNTDGSYKIKTSVKNVPKSMMSVAVQWLKNVSQNMWRVAMESLKILLG